MEAQFQNCIYCGEPMIEDGSDGRTCPFCEHYEGDAQCECINCTRGVFVMTERELEPLTPRLFLSMEAQRRATFDAWPVDYIDRNLMALLGFYFQNGQLGDTVKCYSCSIELGMWEADDDPATEHLRWSPHCRHMHGDDITNLAINEELYRATIDAVTLSVDTTGAGVEYHPDAYAGPAEPEALYCFEVLPPATPTPPVDDSNIIKNQCKICYVKGIEVAFVPCGHAISCSNCAANCETCPTCRGDFESTLRIFIG